MKARLSLLVLCAFVVGCSDSNPVTNTPPVVTSTRVIALSGNLGFGPVDLGTVRTDGILNIGNQGNATLTFTGITGPCASFLTATPTSGTIAPGGNVVVSIRFAPTGTSNVSCNGNLTVASDATSGGNTIAITASGLRAVFRQSGSGDSVFDMPLDVVRVHIVGNYGGSSSNFILKIAGRLIVNELVGTFWGQVRYEGTLLTGGGGVVAITNSSGVAWLVEEVR